LGDTNSTLIPLSISLLITYATIKIGARNTTMKSEKGVEMTNQMLDFRQNMNDLVNGEVDDDAYFERVFEEFLPYMVAFGREQNWIKAWETHLQLGTKITRPPPLWYLVDISTSSYDDWLNKSNTSNAKLNTSREFSDHFETFVSEFYTVKTLERVNTPRPHIDVIVTRTKSKEMNTL